MVRTCSVGRIRKKLAVILRDKFGLIFDPVDLTSPRHGRHQLASGGCSWSGFGKDSDGHTIEIMSWNTMTEIVREAEFLILSKGSRYTGTYELDVEKTFILAQRAKSLRVNKQKGRSDGTN